MARYILTGLLLALVACNIKASTLPSEEEECLEPIENIYYALHDDKDPCQRLGDAVIQYREVIDLVKTPEELSYYGIAALRLGIEPDDDQGVLDFACKLANTRSVEEVAELVGARSKDVARSYRWMQSFLAGIDGFHGFRMGMEVRLAVANAFRDLTGQEEGELDRNTVEQALTADVLAGMLSNLEEQFGPGYLIYAIFRPFNNALVGVDPHNLANAFFDHNIACTLGVNQETENMISNAIFAGGFSHSLRREMVDAYLELYVAADQAGLLNLRY